MRKDIGFIIGCGRSGTHMLGNMIHGQDAHVCFETKLEEGVNTPHWSWVMAMTRNPRIRYRWWNSLIDVYRQLQARYAPKLFVDKSNMCYILAESLEAEFPEAKFIGIKRDLFPSLRSMMKHQGFVNDVFLSQGYEVPNMFSGAMSEDYFSLSIPEKLAWRWCASRQELCRLKSVLSSYLLIDYEDVIHKTEETTEKIEQFLGIQTTPQDLEDKNVGAKEWLEKTCGDGILKTVEKSVEKYIQQQGGWGEY